MERRKTERYIKRLECDFTGAGKTHKGFVSDISEQGLFIRTRRSFKEGSEVDITLHLPDDSKSRISGVVRRALTTQEGTLAKNGMGIELTRRDDNYGRLIKELKGEEEIKRLKRKKPEISEPEKKPEKVVVQCPACGVKNAVPSDKLSLGPKCGACKSPLVPKEEAPAPEEPAKEEPASAREEQSPPEDKKEVEFVIIKCPGCGAKNKVPANKLSLGPKCGNCKEPLPTE